MAVRPKRNTRLRQARYIYVVRLSKAVLKKKRFVRRNPLYDGAKYCLYVGLTSHTPEERFRQHKAGIKSCSYVKQFGKRLLPSLGRRTRKSHPQAVRLEQEIATQLRAKGFAVWQA